MPVPDGPPIRPAPEPPAIIGDAGWFVARVEAHVPSVTSPASATATSATKANRLRVIVLTAEPRGRWPVPRAPAGTARHPTRQERTAGPGPAPASPAAPARSTVRRAATRRPPTPRRR